MKARWYKVKPLGMESEFPDGEVLATQEDSQGELWLLVKSSAEEEELEDLARQLSDEVISFAEQLDAKVTASEKAVPKMHVLGACKSLFPDLLWEEESEGLLTGANGGWVVVVEKKIQPLIVDEWRVSLTYGSLGVICTGLGEYFWETVSMYRQALDGLVTLLKGHAPIFVWPDVQKARKVL